MPTEAEIQRILSSQPKGLEPPSPFRGFSLTAIVGYLAGTAMVVAGISSQGKSADQPSAQASPSVAKLWSEGMRSNFLRPRQ